MAESPQTFPKVNIRPAGSVRFQNTRAPQIDGTFIDTYSKSLDAQETKRMEAAKKKLELNKAMVDNDAEDDLILAQAKLTDARGLNSSKAAKVEGEKLRQKLEDRFSKLSPELQPYAEPILREKLTKFNRFSVPYTAQEHRKVEDDIFKTKIANSVNNAVTGSADPTFLNDEGLAKVTSDIMVRSQRLGLSVEQTNANVAKGVSETILKSVEFQSKTGPDGLARANKLAKDFDTEILPGDKVKVLNLLRAAQKEQGTREAITLADQAYDLSGGQPAQALKFITDAGANDSVIRQASIMLNARLQAEKAQKEKIFEQNTAKLYQAMERGEDPRAYLEQLPPGPEKDKIISTLDKQGGRPNTLTDPATFETLLRRFQEEPGQASATNLDAFKKNLSQRDYNSFLTWQNRIKKSETDEIARAQLGNDDQVPKIINRFFATKGIITKRAKAEATSYAYARYNQILNENPKATRKEINEILTRDLYENGTQEVKTSPTLNKMTMGVFFNKTKNVANPDFAKPDATPEVHESWINGIRAKYPGATDSQVNQIIQKLKDRKIRVNEPRQ